MNLVQMFPNSMNRSVYTCDPCGFLKYLGKLNSDLEYPLEQWVECDSVRIDFGGMIHLDEPWLHVTLQDVSYEVREYHLSHLVDVLSRERESGWWLIPIYPHSALALGPVDRLALLNWAKEKQLECLDSIRQTDDHMRQAKKQAGIISPEFKENPDGQ